MDVFFLMLGVVLLTVGGEALIRGSLAAAQKLGVSPLLSGLVIVGFGTSMPEMTVSVTAALNGQPDIAIGNVIGSNIANILLILGLCAVIMPLAVKPLALRRDAVTGTVASLLFVMLASWRGLGRLDALVLLATLIAFLIWAYRTERINVPPSAELHAAEAHEVSALPRSTLWTIAAIVTGLVLLIGGSRVLLLGAVGIAEHFGVSDAVIGLTIVAVGTSLPELSISVIATLRRHADVAIGNVLGSNIFNLLGILGVSALVQPLPITARILHFDQWVMLGTSLLVLLFLFTGKRVNRVEGAILLAGYGAYVGLSFSAFVVGV